MGKIKKTSTDRSKSKEKTSIKSKTHKTKKNKVGGSGGGTTKPNSSNSPKVKREYFKVKKKPKRKRKVAVSEYRKLYKTFMTHVRRKRLVTNEKGGFSGLFRYAWSSLNDKGYIDNPMFNHMDLNLWFDELFSIVTSVDRKRKVLKSGAIRYERQKILKKRVLVLGTRGDILWEKIRTNANDLSQAWWFLKDDMINFIYSFSKVNPQLFYAGKDYFSCIDSLGTVLILDYSEMLTLYDYLCKEDRAVKGSKGGLGSSVTYLIEGLSINSDADDSYFINIRFNDYVFDAGYVAEFSSNSSVNQAVLSAQKDKAKDIVVKDKPIDSIEPDKQIKSSGTVDSELVVIEKEKTKQKQQDKIIKAMELLEKGLITNEQFNRIIEL